MSADPYSCPNCQSRLAPGMDQCPDCRMRLRGPQAVRLWQVQQQVAALNTESQALIAELLRPAATAPSEPTAPSRVVPQHPHRSLSAQQILLGLGAVLLLSAAAAFLVVIWQVVGLLGQAAIMAGLTATAATGAAAGTRRSLPAAAETAAVVTTGLILVDLGAAHRLDLAGLGGVSLDRYWACASAVGAALLVGCDLVVPRERAGVRLRRILTYRPAAAVLFAAATWLALLSADVEGARRVAGLMLVALVDLLVGSLVARVDSVAAPPAASGAKSWGAEWLDRLPVSALILIASGGLAVAAHLLVGLRVGYSPDHAVADRYAAFGLLLVAPVLVVVWGTRIGARLAPALAPARARLPAVAVTWGAAVLMIPALDAHVVALIVVAGLLAVALTGVWLGLVPAPTPTRATWLRVLTVAGSVVQPLLACAVVLLDSTEQSSMRAIARAGVAHSTVPMLLVVLPAVAWAVSSAVATVRVRQSGWAWVTQAAVLLALARAVANAPAGVQMAVMLVAFTGNASLAAVAAHRTEPFWSGIEVSAVVFGTVDATAAVLAATDLHAGYLSLALFTVGVLTLVYAGAPKRLPFAYLGSLVICAGVSNLLSNAQVDLVEAYTTPLIVLLAGIGAVQWHRDRSLPTLVTAGPALSVALGPSLLVAIHVGDSTRLAAVVALAVAVLLVGLVRRWKAPVTAGTAVLVVVAITQGGPLIGYVPGWLTMAAGAAALLAAGVLWEKAVVAGRRANAWFATLA